MRIAMLGLGRMGGALGARLLEGGHELAVWNRSPGKAGELVAAGARETGSVLEAVGDVEVAVTMLANDEAVRHVALDAGGVVASLAAGSVYVDCSTVSPALSTELAEAAGPERFVALPVLGAPAAVRSGAATYLAGGDGAAVARLEPMLRSLCDKVRRYPEPAMALAAKLATNLVLLSGVTALAESFAVGRAGGLTDDQLRDLLGESPMVAPGLRNRFDGVLTGEQEPWWGTALGAKDAGLAAALARSAGLDAPVAEAVQRRLDEAAGAGAPDDDIATVGRLYRLG
ncbi:MAG TPA: NAD(P)-dependent oxidoreductase [Acidimicrobiales bacterium]|nr:NAD(P)-dependent oxidoreductase [Acidimicrobiales bacterium]